MSTYTLNFIDGVGNMKIYSPMKNNIPVGIAKVKFDLSGGGGSILFSVYWFAKGKM